MVSGLLWSLIVTVNQSFGSSNSSLSELEMQLGHLYDTILVAKDSLKQLKRNTQVYFIISKELFDLGVKYVMSSLPIIQSLGTPSNAETSAPHLNTANQSKIKSSSTKITFHFERLTAVINSMPKRRGYKSVASLEGSKPTVSPTSGMDQFSHIPPPLSRTNSTASIGPEDVLVLENLVPYIVEEGLVLCEYAGKDRPLKPGLEQYLRKLACRYGVAASEILLPVLDPAVADRFKVNLPNKPIKQFCDETP
jgi:hypothetical protein